jgi:hypothetical protein
MSIGSESADPSAGGADDGLHPRGQDHGVPLRAPQEVPEGDIFKADALFKNRSVNACRLTSID